MDLKNQITSQNSTDDISSTNAITLTNKTKRTKKNTNINIPKSTQDSKIFYDLISTNIDTNSYEIIFENDELKLLHNQNELTLNDLTNNESLILSLFINKYHNNFSSKYAKLTGEISNSVLYVFLLPFVSEKNNYIIKVGYTTNLIKRHSELKKEFGVKELKLIYCYKIDGEHTELNIHKNLKQTFNSNIYRMKKNTKIENSPISEETYIFSWLLLKNIYNILYRDYIMKDKIILITKETELKKLEVKKMELELKKSDNELEFKKTELELKKTELELRKTELELKKTELKNRIKKNGIKKIRIKVVGNNII
jgi:hypothetical protein